MDISIETNVLEPIENKTRSIEIVNELLDKAKLNKNDLKPTVQNIYLGKSIASDEIKLIELDEAKIQYLIDGNSLIIRGNDTDNAMCCTKNSTFSFKVAEISNPLLVTSELKFPSNLEDTGELKSNKVEISLMTSSYFVLEKVKPKLQKLRNLLEMNFYCGKSMEENNDAEKYTITDFLNIIQSSEEEIYNYLNYIEAYKIDGYWRLLDYKYYNELLDNILKIIDEKSWKPDQILVNEIYEELGIIYSLSILNQCINYYFTPITDNTVYEIKKQKICHFYAETLLRTTLKMRYLEFLNILKRSLPATMNYEFNMEHIQDICYIDEPYIYYLNILDLPDEIEKRFKYLFEKRKRWTQDELKAFIADLCSNDNIEINNSLTKYCRPFTLNNIKYFTSRI